MMIPGRRRSRATTKEGDEEQQHATAEDITIEAALLT